MPDTVDDFMRRFGAGGTVDDEQAARLHDRFVSSNPEDSQFDSAAYHAGATQHLGTLPDDQFHEAARNAIAQTPPEEREGLVGGLLKALAGGSAGGLGLAGLAKTLGLGSTDPSTMTHDDAARVMNYARKEQPEVLEQTVREKPWFVKAMGNPVVLGALTLAAAKLLSNQRRNT